MIDKLKEYRKLIIKRSSLPNFIIWLVICVFSVFVYKIKPVFHLNENQILYLFSSASQVIAAIYGLIITGYIFLRNELDRKADKDESLEEIILLLKTEYFGSIIGISLTTLLSIVLCFLVIADETHSNGNLLAYLINISVATILTELIVVVKFVITILNPNSLEIASNKLRDLTAQDKTNESGSLEEFLKHYNQIEYILDKYGSSFLYSDLNDYESVKRKRIAKTKLVYILFKEEKIDTDLKNNLIELISFRNSLIHGTNLYVSTTDVEMSEKILNKLKDSLGVA
ncbi:hypothetical protein [Fluviicola chungangensis]|uniref:RiboL-PSP-HEPN domain-containing protein n=1 Tax=Fluviicola chungangensis TaxID=2597671 RepID=A0A556N2V0_9FLAO|nr:hypothetical protein [Fluviicola chungangensis]TSJ46527.1 hypothetical protein FO442_05035 [Fluviicola chungangensis]